MKFLTHFLVVLSVFTTLIGASPLSRRTGSRSPSRSPSPSLSHVGTDHLFIVWYSPLAGVSKRHWAIFVTPSATAIGATGVIYQVLDDTQSPANLKPDRLPDVQASKAGRYEGSVYLGQINVKYMDKHYTDYSADIRDLVADHNKKPANVRPADQSNCQHWTSMMVEWLIDEEVLPVDGKGKLEHIPR
jgi:hypothetical protein